MQTNVASSLFTSLARLRGAGIKLRAEPEIVRLAPRALTSFWVRRCPVAVSCLAGVIWITCENDFEDYFLKAGQRFIARGRGKVVIHAFSAARFAVQHDRGEH